MVTSDNLANSKPRASRVQFMPSHVCIALLWIIDPIHVFINILHSDVYTFTCFNLRDLLTSELYFKSYISLSKGQTKEETTQVETSQAKQKCTLWYNYVGCLQKRRFLKEILLGLEIEIPVYLVQTTFKPFDPSINISVKCPTLICCYISCNMYFVQWALHVNFR